MALENQATELRAELAALKREVDLLRTERDVARMLNQYVYVHDQAFSPVSRKSEELDRQFEEFFTDDGICDAFGVHTSREGKAEWVRSVLSSQGNIIGIQMVTSNVFIDISEDGITANARTSAVTTIAGEGQAIRDHHRAAGYYTYQLKRVKGNWKIAHLKCTSANLPHWLESWVAMGANDGQVPIVLFEGLHPSPAIKMDSEDERENSLSARSKEDYKRYAIWRDSGLDYKTGDPEPPLTLEFSDVSDEYTDYLSELTKYTPPSSGWHNWYADTKTMVYRRWSPFDLALANWAFEFSGDLKQQLEVARFCKHTIIDPTPHHRFLRMDQTRDILRPNLGLNQEGLGRYTPLVAQDLRVALPVMVFLVATPKTLNATRGDMWRHLYFSNRCQAGIICIVNSLYDQYVKSFKLSMEIWSKQQAGLDYPYLLDDCPPPVSQTPCNQDHSPENDNVFAKRGLEGETLVSIDDSTLGRDTEGFLTFSISEFKTKAIVMRHKEEIVVIDETQDKADLAMEITLVATDFMPYCRAQLGGDVEIKPIKVGLESLRECVRKEWESSRAELSTRDGPDHYGRWRGLFNERLTRFVYP